MKVVLNILLFITFLINFNNGSSQETFVNFIPFSTSSCTGNPNGDGYSALVDICFSFGNQFDTASIRSNVFTVFGNEISWTGYKYAGNGGNGDYQCNQVTVPTKTIKNGACLPGKDIILNPQYIRLDNNIYYKVVKSSKPIIPADSFVISYMYQVCQSSNDVVVQYWTNGTATSWLNQNDQYISYCQAGKPTSQNCDNGKCYQPNNLKVTCGIIPEFFNASSSSSESTTGSGSVYDTSAGDTTGTVTGYPNIQFNNKKYTSGGSVYDTSAGDTPGTITGSSERTTVTSGHKQHGSSSTSSSSTSSSASSGVYDTSAGDTTGTVTGYPHKIKVGSSSGGSGSGTGGDSTGGDITGTITGHTESSTSVSGSTSGSNSKFYLSVYCS